MTYPELNTTNIEQISSQISLPLIYRKPNTSKIANFTPSEPLRIYTLTIGNLLFPILEQITDLYHKWLDSNEPSADFTHSIFISYHIEGSNVSATGDPTYESDIPEFIDILSSASPIRSLLHSQVVWEYIDYLVEHLITNQLFIAKKHNFPTIDPQDLIPNICRYTEMCKQAINNNDIFITPLEEICYNIDNNPSCYPRGSRSNIITPQVIPRIRKEFDIHVVNRMHLFTMFVYQSRNDDFLSNIIMLMDFIQSEINNTFNYMNNINQPADINAMSLLSNFPRNGVVDRKSLNYYIYSVSDPMNVYWQVGR